MNNKQILPEPYRAKMVEAIRLLPPAQRRKRLEEAGFNTFLLRSEDVYIDLLTDSGTNAMTDVQWAALMRGDEAYAGSRSFEALEAAVRDVYGFPFIVPTHQGRGAEHLLSRSWIKPGQHVPGNMYFTTTRLHQELAGGVFDDVIVDQAHQPDSTHPFKGDIDLDKLKALVQRLGQDKIAYAAVAAPVNMAGGQPISLGNLKAVSDFCRSKGIRVVLDAARAVENAWFIREREDGYADWTLGEILREMCSLVDACTMSAKKDAYVNIGGFLATHDRGLYEEAMNLCVVYEGLHTYGGLAGRDLEALAVGVREMVEGTWMDHRISQVRYLAARIEDAGAPFVVPVGGHAVFLDARRFLPHLPQEALPAQALSAWLYEECGVRTMERGTVSAGRDDQGRDRRPALELVRLTLPRRVYTQSHLDYVAAGVGRLYARRGSLPGLKFVYEPKRLRFFQSRFCPLPAAAATGANSDHPKASAY